MPGNPANHGLLLILSGPSGVGKTTIAHEVERELGALFSVSATTRPRTSADVEGRDYHFVDIDEFQRLRDTGDLLEWAEVFGNFYGTPAAPVARAIAAHKLMILEIDVQGAIQVKGKMPRAYALFVLPPDEATLLQRLRHRGRDDEATIQRRFAKARSEIALARSCGVYDAFVVNNQLADAVAEAVRLVRQKMSGA